MSAELIVSNLRKQFSVGRPAVDDVSFRIAAGEIVVLLGPSGCGKTTTLRCIAGLEQATSGSISIGPDLMSAPERGVQVPSRLRNIGMVFQSYAVWPHMTVKQNVAYPLRQRKVTRAEIDRRCAEVLELVGLAEYAARPVTQLSGGQMQRVALARALVYEPRLLLLDEPLSNLDAKLRLEMRAEIRRIHDEIGAATIYVTHDQDEALSLADRIVVMREGTVRQIGTPRELYAAPAHLDVAEFMGFRNRLSGKVTAVAGDRVTVAVGPTTVTGAAHQPIAIGAAAIVAVRPEDMTPAPASTQSFAATVTASEYRGRDFYGLARTADGAEIAFRADNAIATGTPIHLSAAEARVLVFAGAA